MNDLAHENCYPVPAGSTPLTADETNKLIEQVPDWSVAHSGNAIYRDYIFQNYYQTIAFVNAVAWIAQQQDHHPEMTVSYSHCIVSYSTHSVGGLTRNDFICAAIIDALAHQGNT